MNSGNYIDRIKNVYLKLLNQYGPFSPRAIAWNSIPSQVIRFKLLSEIGNLKRQSILDVGSGLGDFYNYLKQFSVTYTGIELSAEFAQASKEKYPTIHVIHDDFMTHIFQNKYDWVFCSGAFNMLVDNSEEHTKKYLFSSITKMAGLAKKGVAFNLPNVHSDLSNEHLPFDEEYDIFLYYYDPNEIVTFCKTLSDNVILRTGYLSHDFTIYMYIK